MCTNGKLCWEKNPSPRCLIATACRGTSASQTNSGCQRTSTTNREPTSKDSQKRDLHRGQNSSEVTALRRGLSFPTLTLQLHRMTKLQPNPRIQWRWPSNHQTKRTPTTKQQQQQLGPTRRLTPLMQEPSSSGVPCSRRTYWSCKFCSAESAS